MNILFDKTKQQFEQNLPFVVYKKPNTTSIIGLFQKDDTLFSINDFTEKGFVFASFDGSKTYLIPENYSQIYIENYSVATKTTFQEVITDFPNEMDQISFEKLVFKGIQAINNDEFKKVVLSRKESVDLESFDIIDTFENMLQLYPSTFVYCFFHPKVGLWFGATPEQLLKSNDNKFETIALAGTQKDQGQDEVIWHKKEKKEQQYVTDYIVATIKNVTTDLMVSIPYSIKAGSIWHIKTDISGSLNTGFDLQKVIQLLHPTPAVCGLPKEQSKLFILNNENYERTFYTGFLGELNIENKTDLFVNLRCMEISNAQAHLFMGCGITKDSVPKKEWEESINKSATMKRVLDFRL